MYMYNSFKLFALMWRVPELKKVLAEGERNGLSELCKSGDARWE